MRFTQWLDQNAFTAETIDPTASLDDLAPLRAMIGDARVVAIGESAHHVREFYLLRHRLLRFLVERCGFTVYAFEAPYVEAEAVDAWVHGGPGTIAKLTAPNTMDLTHCPEMHDTLSWLRDYNTTTNHPVRFAGTLAGNGGGSPLPELQKVADYLRRADPDALPLLDRAITAAGTYHAADPMRAIQNYLAVDQAARDTVTANLSRLFARLESMAARPPAGWAAAKTYLRGAWLVDHLHRDMAGQGLATGTTPLDAFIAESVLQQLELDPTAKIVLAVHNVHLRTTEVDHDGAAGLFPAGYHLRNALGDAYLAIAATGNHGRIAAGAVDADEPTGFRYTEHHLPEPQPDSIEAAFDTTAALTIADLRAARPDIDDAAAFQSFRQNDHFLGVTVFDALDAVAYLPHLHTTAQPAAPHS
ncbi:erythromycin esterase family protein [Nonomuraea diastatica]|uniref:Erythromycin esterase family protein n=1 Tax=Nonomuraea diastatica TaxID=1848329 RepID=A0A4R4VPR2_9ACTN|nr:erythromycin esterase family protein [Nonomuraea diastatica]TDD06007.1 erythromycin esterase family protein [Nonomuraea diastatica]